MENIFRIAFWTIALSWMVLPAGSAIIRSDILGPEKILRQNVNCPENMSLHAPPMNEHCMKAALECMISGLRIANVTCKDKSYKIDQVLENVCEYAATLPTPSNATVCEAGPSTPWGDFLSNLTTVLQQYANKQLTAGNTN